MSRNIAVDGIITSGQPEISAEQRGQFLRAVRIKDKRIYVIYFYENAAFVKVECCLPKTIDVGTYLVKEKEWRCAHDYILRLAIKLRVEEFYDK